MQNSRKQVMLICLVMIAIILIIIFAVSSSKKKGKEEIANTVQNTNNEEFVQQFEDGTKLNNSTKLNSTKTFDGMEIAGIQLTEKDNLTLLLGTVTNKSNTEKGDYPVALTILDKNGNTLTVAHGYIKKLAAGESTQLSISKTFDYANAYDFTIAKE